MTHKVEDSVFSRRARLLELADRVEAATGPDRELEALIWCALNGKRYLGHFEAYPADGRQDTQVEYTEPPKRTGLVTRGSNNPGRWTASLDAAMLLVPEGCWFTVANNMEGTGSAYVRTPYGENDMVPICAATPALALTAACLRAIASKEGE